MSILKNSRSKKYRRQYSKATFVRVAPHVVKKNK